jgi:hypothetical protein
MQVIADRKQVQVYDYYTELLKAKDLLSQISFVLVVRNDLPLDACVDVEVFLWPYQFDSAISIFSSLFFRLTA